MDLNNTPFHTKLSLTEAEKKIQQERDNRPVDSHFNQDKGYKFDVRVKEEEKHEHVADRLGHPETLLTPLEVLLRLDRTLTHPSFKDQPFIKLPSTSP